MRCGIFPWRSILSLSFFEPSPAPDAARGKPCLLYRAGNGVFLAGGGDHGRAHHLRPVALCHGEMGAMYYFICWLQERNIKALCGAFVCSGIALLAKNAGVLFFGLSGLLLAQAIWLSRHQLKKLLVPHLFVSIGFAAACCYAALARDPAGYAVAAAPPSYGFSEFLHRFVFFDPVLFLNETIISQHQGESQIRFWNWFLRSLILGDFYQLESAERRLRLRSSVAGHARLYAIRRIGGENHPKTGKNHPLFSGHGGGAHDRHAYLYVFQVSRCPGLCRCAVCSPLSSR